MSNLVRRACNGDVRGDPHMRRVGSEEADGLSFFLYEQLYAFAARRRVWTGQRRCRGCVLQHGGGIITAVAPPARPGAKRNG